MHVKVIRIINMATGITNYWYYIDTVAEIIQYISMCPIPQEVGVKISPKNNTITAH